MTYGNRSSSDELSHSQTFLDETQKTAILTEHHDVSCVYMKYLPRVIIGLLFWKLSPQFDLASHPLPKVRSQDALPLSFFKYLVKTF